MITSQDWQLQLSIWVIVMINEFQGSRLFLNIPIEIAHDKELLKKPKSILLMGEIISMLNVTGKFFMSNQSMAERLDCSTVTIADYLNLLEKKHLIKRSRLHDKRGMVIGRQITAGSAIVKPTLQPQLGEINRSSKAHLTDQVKSTLHKKNSIKEQNNRTDIYSDQRSLTVSQLQDEFEKLWARYPNKKGKKDAFNHYKAWRKASPSKHTVEYISKKLDAYLSYIRQKNVKPRYIMHGSTWFNGRFDDDLKVDDVGSDPNDENSFTNLMKDDPGQPNEDDFPF